MEGMKHVYIWFRHSVMSCWKLPSVNTKQLVFTGLRAFLAQDKAVFAQFNNSWAPFKVADLRNKSSINALTQGGSLCINFGAPVQMYSKIIFIADKKKNY